MEMDDVSRRLLERDTSAAGKRMTWDLYLGVMLSETMAEIINARADNAMIIHFRSHTKRTSSNAL
jgi:hypothetical protein